MYMRILAQRTAGQASAAIKRDEDKPKYEYDSDEDIDGGTWEHKRRKKEMSKTIGWENLGVTFTLHFWDLEFIFVTELHIMFFFLFGWFWDFSWWSSIDWKKIFFFLMTVTSFYVAVATSLSTSKSSIAIVYH